MKYVIKKFEDDYYKIPIQKESKFDALADLDSQCNTYDLCKPNYIQNIFNQYLIEEEDYIVVEKDGIYYHIPELFENIFKYSVELSNRLSNDKNFINEFVSVAENFLLRFDEYIISVE